jgi:hypothetical protein
MGKRLSFGACCMGVRPRAIPRYFCFGVDGPTAECKRCQENSCRWGCTLCSLAFVMCGSRLSVPTLAMGRAHGVVTIGVRSASDVCYCCLSFVLLWTVPSCGPGGGHGPSRPACGGARAAWDQRAGGGRLSPRALLVVFSRRRTHHDYADDLGKIAGRHLE